MKKQWLWMALIALFSVSCIDTQLRQTVYINADGRIFWQIHVREFEEIDSGHGPEQALKKAHEIEVGENFIAKSFWELGAVDVDTRLIRHEPPFEYAVTAELEDLTPTLMAVFDVKSPFWQEESLPGWTRFSIYPSMDLDDIAIDEDLFPIEIVVQNGTITGVGETEKSPGCQRYLIRSAYDLKDLTISQ